MAKEGKKKDQMEEEEQIPGQISIEMLEGGKYCPARVVPEKKKRSGRPKSRKEAKVRKSVMLLPSVYEKAMVLAKKEGTSVSHILNEYLKQYVAERTV